MTKYKVVRLLDFFVAMAGPQKKSTDRFFNGQEVTVGYGITFDDMCDNVDEPHYSSWEDDAPEDEIKFVDGEELPTYDDIFGDDSEEEPEVEEIPETLIVMNEKEKEKSVEEKTEVEIENSGYSGGRDELLSEDENVKIYSDIYFNDQDKEDPGFEFIEFERYDSLFRNSCEIEMEETDKINEPKSVYGSTKNLSWSEVEWNDLKGSVPRYPKLVDPDLLPDLREAYVIESYQRVSGRTPWFFDYVDRYRKDTDSSSSYGYLRIGDILFKFKSPLFSYWRPGKGKKQVVGVAECYISPTEKRGLHAYYLLPHDRLFSKVIDFRENKDFRIALNLDLDLIDRYKIFSKTRLTQYYLGCTVYGNDKNAVICVALVPKGKMCDWETCPYLKITGSGQNGAMLDVGFPPFWNRPLNFDLVIRGEGGIIKIGGFVKFWLTHLVHGTRMWEPSLIGRTSGSEMSGGDLGMVVNPIRTEERKYSSGFSSRGEDLRRGSRLYVTDMNIDRSLRKVRKKEVIYYTSYMPEVDTENDYLSTFKMLFVPGYNQ